MTAGSSHESPCRVLICFSGEFLNPSWKKQKNSKVNKKSLEKEWETLVQKKVNNYLTPKGIKIKQPLKKDIFLFCHCLFSAANPCEEEVLRRQGFTTLAVIFILSMDAYGSIYCGINPKQCHATGSPHIEVSIDPQRNAPYDARVNATCSS